MDDFLGYYIGWRETRIKKIENLFGGEFFKNKKILELGCGHGHTGKHFVENYNSNVTFAEGDINFISKIKENNPNSEVIHLDQDYAWDLKQQFDLIIHWGVLYHLNHWKQDLECALKHTNLLFLESEVGLSDLPTYEFKFLDHDGYDQAVNQQATRPSAAFIESVLIENGFKFTRYDDADINYGNHRYNWVLQSRPETREDYGNRRFWIAEKIN